MKSEVRALEQAVCALVTKLNLLLTAELGLVLLDIDGGLHISTPDHLDRGEDAFVTIRPFRWPKDSFIRARFYRGGRGWQLLEGGQIEADHLSIPVRRLTFKSSSNNVIGIVLDPVESERQFVLRGYNRLTDSLRKDAKAHQK